jgi:hypothetical protein
MRLLRPALHLGDRRPHAVSSRHYNKRDGHLLIQNLPRHQDMANDLRPAARLRRPRRKYFRSHQDIQQRRQGLRWDSRHHSTSPPLNPRPGLPHRPPRSLLTDSQSRPATSNSNRLPRLIPHCARTTKRHPHHILRARPPSPNSLHNSADFDIDECVLR